MHLLSPHIERIITLLREKSQLAATSISREFNVNIRTAKEYIRIAQYVMQAKADKTSDEFFAQITDELQLAIHTCTSILIDTNTSPKEKIGAATALASLVGRKQNMTGVKSPVKTENLNITPTLHSSDLQSQSDELAHLFNPPTEG